LILVLMKRRDSIVTEILYQMKILFFPQFRIGSVAKTPVPPSSPSL
jgi:hypothetical protein